MSNFFLYHYVLLYWFVSMYEDMESQSFFLRRLISKTTVLMYLFYILTAIIISLSILLIVKSPVNNLLNNIWIPHIVLLIVYCSFGQIHLAIEKIGNIFCSNLKCILASDMYVTLICFGISATKGNFYQDCKRTCSDTVIQCNFKNMCKQLQ